MWSYLVIKIYIVSHFSCRYLVVIVSSSCRYLKISVGFLSLFCRRVYDSRSAVDPVEQLHGNIGKIVADFLNVGIILSISSD